MNEVNEKTPLELLKNGRIFYKQSGDAIDYTAIRIKRRIKKIPSKTMN